MNDRLEDINNFLQISDSIATAGQPKEQQFALIAASGYQMVINLALPESSNAIPHERSIVAALGMEYLTIPVIWENPTQKDFDRFANTMQTNSDRAIFIHCAANKRVSAFLYLYRRLFEDLSDREAKQDLQKIWIPNPIWQQFIETMIINYVDHL